MAHPFVEPVALIVTLLIWDLGDAFDITELGLVWNLDDGGFTVYVEGHVYRTGIRIRHGDAVLRTISVIGHVNSLLGCS